MATYRMTRTWQIDLPAVGSYDWNVYAQEAYELGLISPEEGETEEGAWAIAEAMVRDYMVREDQCTAAQYVGLVSEPAPALHNV